MFEVDYKERELNKQIKEVIFDSSIKKEKKYILNLAGGKFNPLFLNNENVSVKYYPYTILNLDKMYLYSNDIEDIIEDFNDSRSHSLYFNHEIFDFLSKFHYQFDVITIYRYLEHVSKNDILFFIYLLSTTVKVGGLIDVIVPDYKKLAKRILNEDPFDVNFERDDIITTFELLNEPYDPHASIWTKERIYKFFHLEERFKINNLYEDYYFDGRDIYIRFLAERIK